MNMIVSAEERHDEVLKLMQEYVSWLMKNDDKMKEVLANQHLEDELADFDTKYAPPGGRLYLALVDDEPAGCIALTGLDDEHCEGKRLYVRPCYRGHKIGHSLMEKIITDARDIGYRYMRLDSFPFMRAAVKMYEEFGFYEIENYNGNPSRNALFFELKL